MEARFKDNSDADLTETLAGRSAVNSQWEEGNMSKNMSNRIITNDDVNSKSNEEKLASDIVTLKPNRDALKIGTWNVRTLYPSGMIDNCTMEMERLQIDVLWLAEVRWTESGIIDKGKYVMAFSGREKNQHGVGIMMTGKVCKALQGYLPISDWVIKAKFKSKPANIITVQLSAPTNNHSDEEIEKFYADVKAALKQVKSRESS